MPLKEPPPVFKQAFTNARDADIVWTLLQGSRYGDGEVVALSEPPDVFSVAFDNQGDAARARELLAANGYEVVPVDGKWKLQPRTGPRT